MSSSVLLEIALILILLVINGVFAMTEIAMVTARKVRLQQRADEGSQPARTALKMLETPNRFLSTIQIAITLVGIFAGAVGGATLAERLDAALEPVVYIGPYSEVISLVIVVLLTTYFTLVIGELIPKRIGMNNPERITETMAGPMKGISTITGPVVRLLSVSTDVGLRLLGIKKSSDPPVTEEEVRVLIEQGTETGVFEEVEQDMVEGVLRLGDRGIDAIMTPRTELEWIDMDDPLPEIIQQVLASNHSRFPIARGSLDNVVGILSARRLLTAKMEGKEIDLSRLVEPPLFIPESMSALKTLDRIRTAGVQAAVVIDEYGGLLGLVTLHDILTAIVGSLPFPGDADSPHAVQREDGSWLLDGMLGIDAVKDLLDVDHFPDEERVGYQTLGGMVMSQLDTIPIVGETFNWNGFRFEVVDMDERRVDKVLVTIFPTSPSISQPDDMID